MRYSLLGLIVISGLAMAAPPDNSEARFEERFRAADNDQNGKLSRSEAYAAFPRAPEYFDEIDRNKDGQVTLKEVKAAMQKRVDAAMASGSANGRYKLPPSAAIGTSAEGSAGPAYASKEEAARAHRYDYYESLAATQEAAQFRGEQTMPLMKKTF
jgi:hypothetical protein